MECVDVNEVLMNKVKELAKKGHLTCAEAHQLAEAEGVSLVTVGKAVQVAGAKIRDCQLGCFGKYKEQ
jgi:predicted nucleic acid-binding protein